jgi:hypothetical protein
MGLMTLSVPVVQRGVATLGVGVTSINVVRGVDAGFDTTIDPVKTILLLTTRSTGGDNTTNSIRRRVIDGDTLTFDRGNSTNAVTLLWELWSFATGCVVQHIEGSFAGGSSTLSVSISAASLGGQRFIVHGGATIPSGSAEWRFGASKVFFNSTTQVNFVRNGTTPTASTSAQVVEMEDISVQYFTNVFSSTGTQFDLTLNPIDPTRTVIFGAYATNSGSGPASHSWRWHIPNSTTARFDRASTATTSVDYSVFVVQLPIAILENLQNVTITSPASTAQANVTVSAVDLSRYGLMPGTISLSVLVGSSATNPGDNGVSFLSHELTSTTNIRTTRGAVGTTTPVVNSIILQWRAPGPIITQQPVDDWAEPTESVIFTSEASSGTPQWQEDIAGTPTDIVGQVGSELILTGLQLSDDGRIFRCAWTNGDGTSYSSWATLNVLSGPAHPGTLGPTDVNGDAATNMTSNLSYQLTPGKFGIMNLSVPGASFQKYFLPETP